MKFHLLKNMVTAMALSLLVVGFSTSCKKPGDTIAKIIVVKSSDGVTRVPNAKVTLSATTDPAYPNEARDGLEKEATAHSNGEASFNYNDYFARGQAGLFVLDVFIEADGVTAEGVIKVVEEETSEATVEINVP